MPEWAVEIRDAVKRFGENTVVNHVSLDIGVGEFSPCSGPRDLGKLLSSA
jgi:ABC-type transporter Mla maintaining outer membrane lipid asymmetry ATPase subunit MlaF